MADTLRFEFDLDEPQPDDDNITDRCLERFRSHYGDDSIGKDDIWEYLYGVMHAPDWRERYRHDLQRNLPRVPFAGDFEAFRAAGRALMDLHIGYETVAEWPVTCLVDGRPDEGDADPDAYRIDGRMRWGRGDGRTEDRSVLEVNGRCRLVDIPEEAHEYTVSGRSPLAWAIDSLRHKHDKASGHRRRSQRLARLGRRAVQPHPTPAAPDYGLSGDREHREVPAPVAAGARLTTSAVPRQRA